MECNECGHYSLNCLISKEKICCNFKSPNYDKFVSEDSKCDFAESVEAVDYRELNAFAFASKYYG